jgi:hypothetical protein
MPRVRSKPNVEPTTKAATAAVKALAEACRDQPKLRAAIQAGAGKAALQRLAALIDRRGPVPLVCLMCFW